MSNKNKKFSVRWIYMIIGVIAMLFAGVLYAWSILKSPLALEFGWGTSELALNFTLAMTFFCLGGFLGARLSGRFGHRFAIITAGVLSAMGFILTALIISSSVKILYLTYGVLAGLGIGISYNVVIATVSSWFPDKKGLCSGCLMMGFGASALILGNAADAMFKTALGWRATYIIIGVSLFVVLFFAALILKKAEFAVTKKDNDDNIADDKNNFTSAMMIKTPVFWMIFIYITFLAAVGSSVISFAKDLALSVNATETLAVSLVGVLSICNGIGRISSGAIFDIIGCRRTMIVANITAIFASAIILISIHTSSLALCVIGLCLAGMSYGSCATLTAATTSFFFGMKYFSGNMALMTFNAMVASFVATLSNKVLEVTGGYETTFIMLLALTFVSMILNLFIRKS